MSESFKSQERLVDIEVLFRGSMEGQKHYLKTGLGGDTFTTSSQIYPVKLLDKIIM